MLALGYAAVAMMLFGGLASTLLPSPALPFSIGAGLLLAAVATWFTGIALNRTVPQRKIDVWTADRLDQLDELVATGRFSLGPGQPQPSSRDEAQEMADELFEQEKQLAALHGFNVHTLFWIPMQYLAFVWAAIALVAVVSGVVGVVR